MPSIDLPARSSPPPAESQWKSVVRYDFAASVVVFLVALPLCMGIAQASGVPIAAGLITGIVGGLVVGLLAGSPLQVSGPAAGLTVIVYGLVQELGLAALGICVLLAGAMQLAAGLMKMGQWFRAVSPAVIRGMLSGIGVLIFGSQFHLMVDDRPRDGGVANLVAIPEAIWKGFRIPELAPREERGLRTGYLKEFGDIHEKQQEIRDLVAERVSIAPDVAQTEVQRGLIAPLIDRQAALLERLRQTAAEARETQLATDGTQSAARFNLALDQALETGEAALAALQAGDLDTVRQRQDEALYALEGTLSSLKKHDWAALLGLLTIGTIIVWQVATPKSWRLIPGALVAVVLTAGLAFTFMLPVLYVELPDNLRDGIHLPSLIVLQELPWQAVLTGAIVLAAVASAETLLCATAVDKMHGGPRTQYDRELAAQGVGNMICGFLGALPMTGVIVRSATNVQAGGRTRWSAVLHGLWLLLFVVALGGLLRNIPTAVLAGILVYTGWKLIDIKALKDLRPYGKSEVGIYIATVVGIVAIDLLTGVLIGIGLSALKLLYNFTRLRIRFNIEPKTNHATLKLLGAATFVRLPKLAAALEQVPPGTKVHIDLGGLTYLDHACMDLISNWTKQHQLTGGDVVVDWDSVRSDIQRLVSPDQPFAETTGNGASNGHGGSNGHGAVAPPAHATPERVAS